MRLARWSHELFSCPNYFDIHLNSKYIAPIESKPLNGKCAVEYYQMEANIMFQKSMQFIQHNVLWNGLLLDYNFHI